MNFLILSVWNDMAIYVGGSLSEIRRHTGATYVFGVCLDGYLETSIDGGNEWHRSRTVFMKPGLSRSQKIYGTQMIWLIIEPGVAVAKRINSVMTKKVGEKFSIEIDREDDFIERLSSKKKWDVGSVLSDLLNSILPEYQYSEYIKVDKRIASAMTFIKENSGRNLAISDVACHVNLSVSRVQHLFKDELGITISQFFSWARICRACRLISKGDNVTNASYSTGFSHGSQLSHVFRRLTGTNLSQTFNSNDVVVQYHKSTYLEDFLGKSNDALPEDSFPYAHISNGMVLEH